MRSERVRLDRAPALVVGRLDDRRAEPLDGAQLGLGRGVHHHHAAARAGLARGERDALRGVAGADRPDAVARAARRGSRAHGVVGAADLERADRLQRFELEEDLRAAGRDRRRVGTSGVRTATS